MKLKILQLGEPVLRQQARELPQQEILSPFIQDLISLMKETMYDAPGVGLAAPQIGLSIQLAVIEDRSQYMQNLSPAELAERERAAVPFHVIINPRIVSRSDEQVELFEACLSITPFTGLVTRNLAITVECLNEKAEPVTIQARGWYARILQHEIDHLHGTVCLDRGRDRSFMTIENYTKYWKEKLVTEVIDLLSHDAVLQ